MNKVKLAWIQDRSQGSISSNHSYYLNKCQALAGSDCDIIFLPELFLWDYFCIEEKIENFDLAIPIDHPYIQEYRQLAKETQTCIFLPIFEKRAPGIYHNSILTIGTAGETLDLYRKMHIPDDPCFYEKYYFTPGDQGFRVVETPKLKVGTLICWDQWFPEAARITAMKGAELLYYPTAIAWDHHEPQEWYEDQVDSWRTIIRSHSIANNLFSLAVNRVGQEQNLQFWGNSILTNPIGKILTPLSNETQDLLIEINTEEIQEHRKAWPFFRDRRIDQFDDLTKRWID